MPELMLASLSVDAREASWRRQLEPTELPTTWLLEEHGDPIAFATCGPARGLGLPPGTGELYALYQLEAVAGTGAGLALLEHVVGQLEQQGFQSAIVWVLESNQRARRFYERAGWLPDGESRAEQTAEGARREVRYGRALKAFGPV